MKTLSVLVVMVPTMIGTAWGQPAQEYETLAEFQSDLWYAELLHAAQLTTEQLEALLEMQLTWQAEAALSPDLATALREVRDRILSGMSPDEAYAALGPRQQTAQQAQGALEDTVRQLVGELAGLLAEEQVNGLVWTSSPAHNLDWVVNVLPDARAWPEAQWEALKGPAVESLSAACAQADPGAGTSPEAIAALLDAARAMGDAEFEAQRATLPQEWAAALLPNAYRQFQNEQYRHQRVTELCRHLITYPRGYDLVEAKLEAMAPH